MQYMPLDQGPYHGHTLHLDDGKHRHYVAPKVSITPLFHPQHRNPEEYSDPETFEPERFVRDGVHAEHDSLTDGHCGFGFGRCASRLRPTLPAHRPRRLTTLPQALVSRPIPRLQDDLDRCHSNALGVRHWPPLRRPRQHAARRPHGLYLRDDFVSDVTTVAAVHSGTG